MLEKRWDITALLSEKRVRVPKTFQDSITENDEHKQSKDEPKKESTFNKADFDISSAVSKKAEQKGKNKTKEETEEKGKGKTNEKAGEKVKEKAKTDLINKELQFLSNYNKTTENNETRGTECFPIANENEEIAEGSCEEESDEFNTSLRSIMNIHEIYQSSHDTLPGGSPECFDKKKKQCKENTRLQKDKGFANREFQVKLPEQTDAIAQNSNDRYFPKSKSKNTCHFCFLKEKKSTKWKRN